MRESSWKTFFFSHILLQNGICLQKSLRERTQISTSDRPRSAVNWQRAPQSQAGPRSSSFALDFYPVVVLRTPGPVVDAESNLVMLHVQSTKDIVTS